MASFIFIENNGTLRSLKKPILALGIGCGWCLLVGVKSFICCSSFNFEYIKQFSKFFMETLDLRHPLLENYDEFGVNLKNKHLVRLTSDVRLILIACDDRPLNENEKILISSWNFAKVLFNIHLYISIIQQCGGMP